MKKHGVKNSCSCPGGTLTAVFPAKSSQLCTRSKNGGKIEENCKKYEKCDSSRRGHEKVKFLVSIHSLFQEFIPSLVFNNNSTNFVTY